MSPRVLMVDDEPRVLDALRRTLAGRYQVAWADSGQAGLQEQRAATVSGQPFAVIVSDMMMPGMNGAQFLTAARQADPDVVALILSGQADLDSTISAVNDAGLFGFLTKPCPPEVLTRALDRALDQHALILAERDLLERTVRGAVDMLTELMASSSPLAYARSTRIKEIVAAISPALGLSREWALLLAARLSQVGCLAVPVEVLQRAYGGSELSAEERAVYQSHRTGARAMLERIPRLETVAQWIGSQPLSAQEAPPPDAGPAQLAFCASVSLVEAYEESDDSATAAAVVARSGFYPADLVTELNQARLLLVSAAGVLRQVTVGELREGMDLEQDVVTGAGLVLVRRGEPVTETLVIRLRNFADTVGIVEPIRVIDYRGTAH